VPVDELDADNLLDACLVKMTAISMEQNWEESEKRKRDIAREPSTLLGGGNRYWLCLTKRKRKVELKRLDKEARRFARELEQIDVIGTARVDTGGREHKHKAVT